MPTNPTPTFQSLTLSGGTVTGVPNAVNPSDVVPFQQTFVASGASAAAGLVPSPGTTAGTTRFLREDATWQLVPGSGTTFTFVPQAAPTLAAGITWGDSTQNALQTYINGASGWIPTVLMVGTAITTISLPASTPTSILPSTFIGTATLPANFLVAGKTLCITIHGYVSTAPTSASPVAPYLVIGSTTIGSGSALPGFDTTSTIFALKYTFTCLTTGSSGTVMSSLNAGADVAQSAVSQTSTRWSDDIAGASSTVNTTVANALNVKLSCGAALTVKITHAMIEVIA